MPLLVRHHRGARLTGLSGGTLRLGTFQTAGVHLLPPVLSAFRRAHPDVELTVANHEPPAGVAAVAAGEIDLALTHTYEPAEPVVVPASVTLEPVPVEELVLVTAPGHALAEGTSRLPLSELAGQPLISMAPDHPARQGGWVGVVPEMVARTAVTPVGTRALEGGELRRTISVALRSEGRRPLWTPFGPCCGGVFATDPAGPRW